jgi:hypothetical protein
MLIGAGLICEGLGLSAGAILQRVDYGRTVLLESVSSSLR